MLNYLKYYYHRCTNPKSAEFVDEGLGIQARYQRCRKFWEKHIQFTKEIQAKALAGLDSPKVAVLGAGRLYDVNLSALQNAKSISLFDADPSCASIWKRKLPQAKHFIGDVTEILEDWTDSLYGFLTSRTPNDADLVDFLDNLRAKETTLAGGSYDCIISVNLLSQITVCWRDRAGALIEEQGWAEADDGGFFPDVIQQALVSSMIELEQQHLTMLDESSAKSIALIFDTHFYGYEKNIAHWDVEEAVISNPEKTIVNFNSFSKESWLWHVAPQDIEYEAYGLIHQVDGWCILRKQAPQ